MGFFYHKLLKTEVSPLTQFKNNRFFVISDVVDRIQIAPNSHPFMMVALYELETRHHSGSTNSKFKIYMHDCARRCNICLVRCILNLYVHNLNYAVAS